jgi:outer membrane protein OmpA-like peptidoglycan-associated protein
VTVRSAQFFLTCGLGLCLCQIAMALPLDFPGNARLDLEIVTPIGRYPVPTGPWSEGYLPTTDHDGELTEQVWRIDAASLTTLQLITPLRENLEAEGFAILFECETEACGGFDFRTATVVLPPPEMFVGLSDFRFLSAMRGDEALTLLVSRTNEAGYVQVIRIGPPMTGGSIATSDAPSVRAPTFQVEGPDMVQAGMPGDFGTALDTYGRVVLSDLAFPSGSAQLAPGDFASLQQLADYLAANPSRRVALVGHTDSQGTLEANIALSKRRAGSVVERLTADYDVPRQQLEAEGMGYLSPIATNLTEEGREANRRVEVIVTSTE